MFNKERFELIIKIYDRAEKLGCVTNKQSLLMDLESADNKFNLRLEEFLAADDLNFAHDIIGITNNVVRDKYPADDFGLFVPRFAQN